MKLIDKDTLVAEIENRKDSFYSLSESCETGTPAKAGFYAQAQTLEGILSFLNTFEVKEVDLEKYYRDFLQKEWFDKDCSRTISEMMAFTAKHFFELGLKQKKRRINYDKG